MDGQKAPSPPTAGLLKDKTVIEDVEALKARLFSNLALCHTKFANHEHVVALTKGCLDVKSLYRCGSAQLELGDYDGAVEALEKAVKLEPNNKAVASKLQEARSRKS